MPVQKPLLERICISLGKNNKATYPVMAIALVKGICRPTFTMMDKKEKPETKKYTALREGLTELIAIPTYFACGELSAWGARKLIKNEALAEKASKNLMFIGVCVAALFAIPALCSLTINPIVKRFLKKQKENAATQPLAPDTKISPIRQSANPVMQNFGTQKFPINYSSQKVSSGMKVGGL